MRSRLKQRGSATAFAIFARLHCDDAGKMPAHVARYVLKIGFTAEDNARMHDLIVRNQDDALTTVEKEELFAYGNAGTMLSILKSRARRVLGVKLPRNTAR